MDFLFGQKLLAQWFSDSVMHQKHVEGLFGPIPQFLTLLVWGEAQNVHF